jgi:hypothetical protein
MRHFGRVISCSLVLLQPYKEHESLLLAATCALAIRRHYIEERFA